MKVSDIYNHLPFVFSGNVSTLTVTGLPEDTRIPFVLKVHSPISPNTLFENRFELYSHKDEIVLHLKEMLENIPDDILRNQFLTKCSIVTDDGERVWEGKVQKGRCNVIADYTGLSAGYWWWTRKPQQNETYRHGIEQLSIFVDYTKEEGVTVYANLYFRLDSPKKILLLHLKDSGNDSQMPAEICVVNCAYDDVKGLAIEDGYTDEIVAYDIFVEGHEDRAQRFVVKEDRSVKEFIFRNHLGVYDFVYAFGEMNVTHNTETKTFVNSGIEKELLNDGNHSFESNTGYIDSAEKAEMWFDFFASAERSVLEEDGSWRSIVVESTDNEIKQMELGSMSFKWHYSEDIPDRLPARRKLKPYIQKEYGIPEL